MWAASAAAPSPEAAAAPAERVPGDKPAGGGGRERRRSVGRPLSYAEPNAKSKARQGMVYFQKDAVKGKETTAEGAAGPPGSLTGRGRRPEAEGLENRPWFDVTRLFAAAAGETAGNEAAEGRGAGAAKKEDGARAVSRGVR